jgi:hypothetical protein
VDSRAGNVAQLIANARSKTTVNFGSVHFNPFILESLLQAINDESAAVIF